MGYTHYLNGCGGLSKENLRKWINATNQIIKLYNKTASSDKKVVNCQMDNWKDESEVVLANGRGDNGHETLYIASNGMGNFQFCKTARKPYDAVVVASYMWAEKNFPTVDFSSDGDESDHVDGIKLLKEYMSL